MTDQVDRVNGTYVPDELKEDRPKMDWRVSWRFRNGKEEEYTLSDLGAAMQGLNQTVAIHWPNLESIKLEPVEPR